MLFYEWLWRVGDALAFSISLNLATICQKKTCKQSFLHFTIDLLSVTHKAVVVVRPNQLLTLYKHKPPDTPQTNYFPIYESRTERSSIPIHNLYVYLYHFYPGRNELFALLFHLAWAWPLVQCTSRCMTTPVTAFPPFLSMLSLTVVDCHIYLICWQNHN